MKRRRNGEANREAKVERRKRRRNGEANWEGKTGRDLDAAPNLSKRAVLQIGGFHRLDLYCITWVLETHSTKRWNKDVLGGVHRLGVYWHPTKHTLMIFIVLNFFKLNICVFWIKEICQWICNYNLTNFNNKYSLKIEFNWVGFI